VALAALVALYVLPPLRSGTTPRAAAGTTVTISVEPFETSDSVPPNWASPVFAESLANRLSRVPWLEAHTPGLESGAHYTLRGRVTMQAGRLVLAARLGSNSEQDTVWTATFWRNRDAGNSILPDLASAVAEAITSEAIRQTQLREKK
jgi:hypothetical protein